MARECHPAVGPSCETRCVGRGTGAVKATGSWEGSLPMEGIPDHDEAPAFTSRRHTMVSAVFASSDPCQPVKTRAYGERQHRGSSVRREEAAKIATGMSEARSPECRGKKTPTLVSPAREGLELEVSTQ